MGIRIVLFSVLVTGLGLASNNGYASDSKPQGPSVNQPIVRTSPQPVTGPQYVREPIIKQPIDHEPAIQRVRQQLDETKKQIAPLQAKRDSMGKLNPQDSHQLQALLDRKAKAEQQLSELLRKQSESSQQAIQNIK